MYICKCRTKNKNIRILLKCVMSRVEPRDWDQCGDVPIIRGGGGHWLHSPGCR